MFSQPVKFVANTGIFARATQDGRQYIAYQMKVGARHEMAMILPIPVRHGSSEDAVHFVNLEGYPTLFDDLERSIFGDCKAMVPEERPGLFSRLLKVEQVGSFEASFVPTLPDFSRLDPRFRLPDTVWQQLGRYANYGFTVFQLRKGEGKVHPMAFSFPTARPDHLFFPTVHVHDGKVHATAKFDHSLFAQVSRRGLHSLLAWEESFGPASDTVKIEKTRGLVAGSRHVFHRKLTRRLPNEDTWLRIE